MLSQMNVFITDERSRIEKYSRGVGSDIERFSNNSALNRVSFLAEF